MGGLPEAVVEAFPGVPPDAVGYRGGRVQRIDTTTGGVTDVCTHTVDGAPLLMPDDLVFDAAGGFYFTDLGRLFMVEQAQDVTGIYYCAPGDTAARKVAPSQFATNGIGLSPDGRRLWWTEYYSGRLLARDVVGPGELAEPDRHHGDCLYVHATPVTYFDSLTVMADGSVVVAVHDTTPTGKSGIMSFAVDGHETGFVPVDDPLTTHIAFGGADLRTGYITAAATGRLLKVDWPTSGLPVPHLPN
jgi:gluconolactonase